MHDLLYVCDTCRGRALAYHFSSSAFGVARHWPRSGGAMSDVTAIEWTDHTFNPWWGCSRVSPACRFCYADRDAQRYGHQVWRRHGPRRMLSEANWQRPLRWNRDAERAGIPAKVFCASMADVFEDHPDVAAPRERLWGLIEATPWLIWQLLTKRPENIARMVPWGGEWPPHVWVGTSVENQRYADERIPVLVSAPGCIVIANPGPDVRGSPSFWYLGCPMKAAPAPGRCIRPGPGPCATSAATLACRFSSNSGANGLRRTAQPGRLATPGRTRTATAGSALTMGAPSRSGNSPAPMISPGRT